MTAPFVSDARYHAKTDGLATLRVVATPAVPILGLEKDKVREQANLVINAIVSALTASPTSPEKPSEAKAAEARSITRTDIQDVNRYFLLRHWTDGAPVIPPTEEAVRWMLTGTDRAPDAVVALIPPRNGRATVEVIATNAVMAGCRPEYMPVLIAAVEAMSEPQFNLSGLQATTNSVAPFLILNGQVRRDLNVNCEMGLIGYGWQANNTIGRALRLLLIAAGGSWPRMNAMSTLGKLPICVIGEWEEVSPWQPLHVELGYDRNSSTVTVVHAAAFHTILAGVYPANRLLANFGNIMGVTGPLSRTCWWGVDLTFIMNPLNAATRASEGYSKEAVKVQLMKNARIPFSEYKHSHYIPGLLLDTIPWFAKATEDTMIPLLDKPEQLSIVVASGQNYGHSMFLPAWGPYRSRVTKEIRLPANWGELMEKARKELEY